LLSVAACKLNSVRPPGPKPHFLIGNIPLADRDPLAVYSRWVKEFGNIFYYRAGWVRVYFLNDPDLIDFVLVRHYQDFLKDRVVRNSRWLFGNGLLTNEGESWKKQRRLAQPSFHRERIASYGAIMTEYAEQAAADWRHGAVIDIHQEMMRLTLAITIRVLFGLEFEGLQEVSKALNVLARNISGVRLLFPSVVRLLPRPGLFEFRRAIQKLEETVYEVVDRHRRSGKDSGDLLSMLVAARDEDGNPMSDRQIRDEVMTFLLAGHETTALALSWAWHLLAENPAADGELNDELQRVLGDRLPKVSDLPSLPYAEGVIKESMRLYPPAWALGRTAARDIELGGYRIPAGANIVMSPWVRHRDARYFPSPGKFDPCRWSSETTKHLPRFAYFPFGAGPRQCIGAAFATLEAVVVLATIARKFQVRPVPGHPVEPLPSLTLRPKSGVWVELRKRDEAHTRSQPVSA